MHRKNSRTGRLAHRPSPIAMATVTVRPSSTAWAYCRSQLAREESESAVQCQATGVIFSAHREQARSHSLHNHRRHGIWRVFHWWWDRSRRLLLWHRLRIGWRDNGVVYIRIRRFNRVGNSHRCISSGTWLESCLSLLTHAPMK
jgi:hypothetical protein